MPAKIPSRLLALATAMAVLGAALLLAAHPVSAQTPNNNANLSALSILGTAVPGFNADTTSYTISLDAPERPATIAATAADANATVEYNPADADTETGGHQVVLNEGDNTVTVTVIAEDTTTTKSYTVTVTALDAADSAATTAQAAVDDRTSASAVHYLGSIGEAGDVDWIRVELESDQMYRFALKGSYRNSGWTLDVPVIIGLYNDEGGYINGTHAVGSVGHQLTTNARLHYMAEADGDYYVGVRGIEDQTGTYGLRVLEVPDDVQPDNASTPGAIAVDGSQQGVIDYRGDVDWYQVSALESRKEYVVELSARAGWPLRLPTVLVYDSAGDPVRVDYLESLRSRAVFTPSYGGTYYIAALSRFNSTGRYTLELARVPAVAVAVTVSFGAAAYSAAEGGAVEVIVTLSEDPKRPVTIPISKANRGGASDADYSGVPASVTFESTDTERTFTFRATDDTVDDDGESVTLSFGTLPDRVTEGAPATATVSITDNDVPDVTVSFGAADYSAAEGSTVDVKLTLSADPERPVTIPIDKTEQGGAGSADYSGVPASVTFESGETERSFTFTATDDTVADDGESVILSFGTLPTGVSAGTPATATVSITDDDVPANWSLIPTGLGAGAEFRLLFVTSGSRNGHPSDIADYNTFVQNAAGGGHTDIRSRRSLFRALGSTKTVDARDNTATTHTPDDRGVPIYWLNGPKAADDYADFYDGSWDHRNPAPEEDGGSVTFGGSDYILTGSLSDGTGYRIGDQASYLGSSSHGAGSLSRGAGHEISSILRHRRSSHRFYGLSGVFRVEGVAAVDNAELSDLRVDGTSVAGFAASTTSYTVGVADTVDQVTIAASTADPGATLAYGVDADPDAAGHQVDFPLSDDQAAATVTVTAQDSTTKTYTVNLVRPVPGPPTIASVTPGDGTLTVAWSAPTETGGANIIAYGVRYILTNATDKADANWTVVEDAWASGTLEYVIATGLTHDMEYDVQVRAVNSRGDGEWSATGTGTPAVSTDATLSSLTVSPVDIDGFAADRTTYHVGVASTVAQVTITAEPANSNAAVAYDPATDDDANVVGHQVDLSDGLNTVTVTVTAQDGMTNTYTLHLGRGVTDAYGWKAEDDFNYLERAENAAPYGLWSDGETMWVVDALVDRLYAYNLETRARVPDQDFTTLTDSGNNHAGEIWSDGEIMWVVDWKDKQLYAYDRDTKARVPGRDFTSLDAGNVYPIAIWSDGETIWIADNGPQAKIFAYDLETKERIAGQDFTRLDQSSDPRAIWSDGAIMWTGDIFDRKLYAYDMETKQHVSARDFTGLNAAGNESVTGVWSDGETMWAADGVLGKLYSYNLPPSDNADLRLLSVDRETVEGFAPADPAYSHVVDGTVTRVTVAAEARQFKARVTGITPADANANAAGHQVDLNPGANTVAVTVTAQNGSTRTYTVNVIRKVVPGAPTIDTVAGGDGTLTVAWSAPTETGGEDIIAYDLRYILTSADETADANWTVVDDAWTSGTLEYVIATGLTNGMEYDVQVRAVNSGSDGEWSPTRTGTPATKPGAPTISTVAGGGYGSLTVSWSAPAGARGGDITAYGVRYILTSADDKADANWVVIEDAWATDPGGDLAYTIAGLTPGEDYDVQVRAVNSVGAGDWSATAAAAAGRFTLVPYDWGLRADSVAGGQSFRLLFVTSQGRWATFTDLASYDRRVQERAAEGHSDIRAYSAQFKVLGSSETIAARDNTRTNPNTRGAGEPVYWLDGPRVADDYADFYDGWDNSNPARNETGASRTFRPYVFGNVTPEVFVWTGTKRDGSSHEGHYLGSAEPILGMPADGESALGSIYSNVAAALFPLYGLSGVFRLADPPPATATLTALTVSPGEIEGFAPDSPDSTEYDVGVASTVAQVTITAVPSSSRATLAYDPADDADPNADGHQVDFTPGANTVTVTLTVTAQDSTTTGTYTVNFVRPVVVPGAPTIDTVTPGDGTLTVAWSAPSETGDTDIFAYGVRHILTSATDKADANWVVIEDAWTDDPGGDLAYTIAGLTPGSVYDVQVRAVNSAGAGDWSATGAAAGRFTLVPYDWGLRPDSVAGGQSFRLLFVTSQGRWATSGDLASYDRRVQERAAEGHSDIRAYSAQFKVLGSNGRIAARDNTRTNPNTRGAGEPVYWLDGPRVADDYADFYDGWDNSNPARNETGASITFRPYESGSASRDQAVWTGTNRDGSIDEGHYLGSSEPILGMPADGESALGSTYSNVAAALFPLYGLSGVFRVADLPPATATLTVLTVSPGDIEGFAPDSTDSTEYDVSVASTVAQVTITAVPSSSQATLAYDPADDADPNADGHQVDFTPGANTVTVTLTVTAQDGNTTRTYTVNVIRETKPVTVSFGEADYDVAEGGEVEVTVSLNEAPGREVEIPITATGQDGASEADYSPSATTVTFASGETEQRFTFTATDDTVDDDGESVTLSFGTLPDRVTEGAPATATVSITDNDVPDVTVSFGAADYSAAEGSTVDVKLTLSADPERPVTIPIDKTEQGGAGSADYSGVPASVTFESGETERSFTFTATDDTVADGGESVTLSFGTLPAGVTEGSTNEATVDLADNDVPTDWSLIPTGLGAGAEFRLLFVTSGSRDALSGDIADYNTFVQNAAGGGHTDIRSHGSLFRALGSTKTVDARDNTATTHTADDRGVPIYWLNGPKAADDYADFYDGSWDHRNPAPQEDGGSVTFGGSDYIWTGSFSDGTEYLGLDSASSAFGRSGPRAGNLSRGAGHEITDRGRLFTSSYPLYGLSGVFRVEGEGAVDNAELSDLRVDGTSVNGFSAATTSYTVGVADTVDQVTIAASTADPDATLAYGVDADPDAGGHQVDLIPGVNTVAVTVTAQDTTTTKTYTLTISRAADGATAPEVNSAAVSEDGMSIRLVFDQDLDATPLPAASAFAVAVGTAPAVAPSGVAVPATDADTVVLTMSAAIAEGQTVSLDYTAPATGGLLGALGGVVESFTREVVNRLDPPAAVRAFAGNERFDVEWDAPASGATVSGYRVQWKVPSGSYDTTNSADVAGEVLEHAVTGLTNGDAYVVRVRALNSARVAGAGAESEPLTVGRPRAVRNARATGRKADFRVDWEAPVERGEGFLKDADDDPVLVYRISWEREGQSQDLAQYQAICRDGSRKTSVNGWLEVTDVSPYEYTSPGDGDTYSFTIQARFQAGTEVVLKGCHGQTGYGEEAQATATEGRATASAADHEALRAALESFVDARDEGWPWLRTVWDHISGLVVAEDLDPRRDGETDLQCTSTNSGDTLSGCSFNGLSIDLDWDLLGEEGFDYVAVHELAHVWTLASALHDRETRTPVGHAVLYFLGQEYSGDSEVMEACALETLGDTVSHVAEGVAPTRLTYYGDRCFSDGRSEPAELSEAVVLHALHPSGTAPGGNAGEAASSWFADAYTGASAGADAWAAVMDIDTNKRRALMTNLLQDKFGGYCSIGAANRAFFVDGSDITDPWQDGGCAPDAPAVTATAGAAAGSIAVSWTAPASGGAPLLGYKVQWKPASDEWPAPGSVVPPREADLDDPSAVSHTITGLNAGAEYTVRVRADNSIGDGDFSGDATVTSGGTVNRSAPPPPQNLRVVMEEGAVKLTWDAPEDDTVTSYRIDRRRSGGGRGEAQTLVEDTGSADTGYTDKSAETGVEYQYRVSARNQAGPGQASEWVSAAPAPESNTPATGAPTIGGTAQVGETLTADTSGIADTDGLDSATFSYQWVSSNGTTDTDITGATDSTYTMVGADEGRTVRVRVSFTDDAENEETLTSTATAAVEAAPTPLTASIHHAPESHDGLNSFTFELRFSEEPAPGFSYKTLRDHAFMVTGGGVTGARRLERPSNVRWEITVLPDSDAAVTVVLPVTAACEDEGAICTEDGRMLSAEAALTVGGPVEEEEQTPPENSPATGTPTISGTAQVGETLTADTTGIADADGLVNASYSYQWVANDETSDADITGATASTYTLADADEGKGITVRVSFADDAGNAETLTSTATATVQARPNSPATGTPTITGAAEVGETLTADTTGIADADGLVNASYSYQWVANDETSDADITGATGSTYTLVSADEGKTVKVRVSFADDMGNEESLTSAATAAVAAKANSPATGAPTISGTAQVGETLAADISAVADTDGLGNATFGYQWVSNNGTTDTDITGATGSTYTLVGADEGRTIKVRVSFTDDADNQESLTSAATAAVAAKANSPATGAPTISGTAQIGETLAADTSGIADTDGLSNATFSYQWVSNNGTTDTDITGATDSSYTLADSNKGKAVKVKVTFTDDAGNQESVTSAATEAVAAKPNSPATGAPTISGTAQVGETLAADTSGIADTDGLSNATFSYQWVSNNGTTDTDITGATFATYTLVSADEGRTVKVRVSFTDDAGNPETLTSTATDAIAPVPTGEEESEDDSPIWSATMTAGLLDDGYGYSAFAGGAGELSETEFELDGVTYTIKSVVAWGWMYIAVDKKLPTDFRLEVDGKQFDSRDASLTSYSYANVYKWEEAQLEWAEGDTIELALYRAD